MAVVFVDSMCKKRLGYSAQSNSGKDCCSKAKTVAKAS